MRSASTKRESESFFFVLKASNTYKQQTVQNINKFQKERQHIVTNEQIKHMSTKFASKLLPCKRDVLNFAEPGNNESSKLPTRNYYANRTALQVCHRQNQVQKLRCCNNQQSIVNQLVNQSIKNQSIKSDVHMTILIASTPIVLVTRKLSQPTFNNTNEGNRQRRRRRQQRRPPTQQHSNSHVDVVEFNIDHGRPTTHQSDNVQTSSIKQHRCRRDH